MTPLQTPRLFLRPWRDADLAPYAALNADPEVMRHFPALLSREESDAQAGRIRANLDARGWGLWAVEVKNGPPFIGFVGLAVPGFDAPFMPATEIGWRLARAAWGLGYASEAARAALGFGFTQLGLDDIVSFTSVGNQRSRAVMERLGMQNTGQDFDHPRVPVGSPLRRHLLYRLARSDWRPD